jgi:ankyrin repeat protein
MKYLTMVNYPDSFKMAATLIQRGADINYQNAAPFGRTALHVAIMKKHLDSIGFLLQYHLNPHIEDYSGKDCCYYFKLLPQSV